MTIYVSFVMNDTRMHTCTSLHTWCICTYTSVCILYIYIYMWCVRMRLCMYARVHLCIYLCICVCMCVCMYEWCQCVSFCCSRVSTGSSVTMCMSSSSSVVIRASLCVVISTASLSSSYPNVLFLFVCVMRTSLDIAFYTFSQHWCSFLSSNMWLTSLTLQSRTAIDLKTGFKMPALPLLPGKATIENWTSTISPMCIILGLIVKNLSLR